MKIELNPFTKIFPHLKLVMCLLAMLVITPIHSQNIKSSERWDADSYVYSNFKYGFSWSFPTDIKWNKIAGSAKHTIFKVRQPDLSIIAYVNINKIESTPQDKDIWDFYQKWESMIDNLMQQAYEATGEKTTQRNNKKCMFCGKRAIKQRYTSFIKDDRYKEPLNLITISYYFILNWNMCSATIKMPKEAYDALSINGLNAEDIFKGFSLIPTE